MPSVTLREITATTVRAVCELKPCAGQERYVAPVAVSIAQAHFTPTAWFRAIYAGEDPVGFLMLRKEPENGTCFLWRLIIDCDHQRRGFGRAAVSEAIQEVLRWRGITAIVTSCGTGEGDPRGFYAQLGFQETGQIGPTGEIILRKELTMF
jgi:diamine N-acetyltransferase